MQRSTWALCLLCGLDGAGALSIWTPTTARAWRTRPSAAMAINSRPVRASDIEGHDGPISADELTVEWDHGVPWFSTNKVAELVEKHGCCCVRGVMDPAVIDALRDTVMQRYETCKAAIAKKGKQMTDPFAFYEICHETNISFLRYDLRLTPELSETCLADGKVRGTEPLLPHLFGGKAPLLAVVEKVLGNSVKPYRLGSVIAEPTSMAQKAHRDSPHLWPDHHAPPHTMSLFLPLIDVSLEHGPTDFWPGSHLCGANDNKEPTSYEDLSVPKVQFPTRVGDAIAFDYRIVHRGAPNESEETRPIFYHDFSRRWVDDDYLPPEKLGLDSKPAGGFGAGSKAATGKTKKSPKKKRK